MNKIKNVYISYWFNEIDYNPAIYVNKLQEEINSIINTPIMYNDSTLLNNISMPRIEGISSDKKYFFSMSLINAFLSINLSEDILEDEVILLINNVSQLFYDILKDVYNTRILYTSIKIEFVDNRYSATEECDGLILITEWKELRNPDFDLLSEKLNEKVIFDGRNIYDKKIREKGFELFQIGC